MYRWYRHVRRCARTSAKEGQDGHDRTDNMEKEGERCTHHGHMKQNTHMTSGFCIYADSCCPMICLLKYALIHIGSSRCVCISLPKELHKEVRALQLEILNPKQPKPKPPNASGAQHHRILKPVAGRPGDASGCVWALESLGWFRVV